MVEWKELRELLRSPNSPLVDIAAETNLNAVNTEMNKIATVFPYMSLSPAGLVIGAVDAAEVLITNTVVFLIAGNFKSKSTAEVPFTATDDDITAESGSVQGCTWTLSLNFGGDPTLTKGVITALTGTSVAPAPPQAESMIGTVRVEVDAGSTDFNATSDDLDAAHLTTTYTDVSGFLLSSIAEVPLFQ